MKNNEKIKNSNIKEIKYLFDVTENAFTYSGLDNSFAVFKTINNLLYLIYSNEFNSIICINLENLQKVSEMKNCHKSHIGNFIFYSDIKSRRDLMLSISCNDLHIKLWNINNFECLLNIRNLYSKGRLLSACFINGNNNIYIATCHYDIVWVDNSGLINILDLNGKIIKKINKSNEMSFYIDSFYDKNKLINFILTGNKNYVKSYNYDKNILYHKYYDLGNEYIHSNILIYDKKDIIKLIETCYDGNLRIWDFHSGFLINKIKISDDNIRGLCLWNEEYLLVGCFDKTIKLVELNNDNYNIINLIKSDDELITIKKINHPLYGECLLTQGSHFSQIKIWGFKD